MSPASGAEEGGSGDAGGLTHVDGRGRARMVDVSAKARTHRVADARCVVVTTGEGARTLADPHVRMDVVEGARFAGIQAAKQTADLIPLCHPILVDHVTVDVVAGTPRIEVRAVAEIVERTGVEMEALTACAFAALSLVKALAGVDPGARIEELMLWDKTGGRSGDWHRTEQTGKMARQE